MLQSTTWSDIRDIETQVLTLKHLQGNNAFDKMKELGTLKELKRQIPIEEQYAFAKLVDQSQKDYKAIIDKSPQYYRQMLMEIYENKIKAQQGYTTNPYIDEDYHKEYEQEVYNKQIQQMDPRIGHYQETIDVEQYRTLLQMRNTKNLAITGLS